MRRLAFLPAVLAILAVAALGALHTAAPASAQALPRAVVVIKQYGAALRYTPDSDNGGIYYNAACGDILYVTDSWQGWYQVYSPDYGGGLLWVGGARVANASNPPYFSCRNAVPYQMGDRVVSFVPSGCLSVRYYPSRQAPYDYCVRNGTGFTLINGPIEVNGEDWFGVTSRATGDGWVLADYISYPQ